MPYTINLRSSDAPVPKSFTLKKMLNTVKVLFVVGINVRGFVKNYKFVDSYIRWICVCIKKKARWFYIFNITSFTGLQNFEKASIY